MRLRLSKETLLQGVSRTQGVIDRRGTAPVLSHCLLEARNGKLLVGATDFEVSFRGYYPADIEEEGGLCVPAVNFHNIVKVLPEGEVHLAQTDNRLTLQMGRLKYDFVGLPLENFPPLPPLPEDALLTLPAAGLREMLEKTIFSVASDELQQHLAGIYFERVLVENEPRLRLVSSDGHRLSLVEQKLDADFSLEQGILLPRKGVSEMLRSLEGEEPCGLGLLPKMVVLRQGEEYLFMRLLERKFPDYQRIIQQQPVLQITLERQPFLEVLRRISQLSSDRFKGVILGLHPDFLQVRYQNPLIGGGEELLPLEVAILDPDRLPEELNLPFEVSYNARYLAEPLTVMKSSRIRFQFIQKKKPLFITGDQDPHYLSVVMPMDLV